MMTRCRDLNSITQLLVVIEMLRGAESERLPTKTTITEVTGTKPA